MVDKPDWDDLRSESSQIWEKLAGFWDDSMGDEGNDFHRRLVAPMALSLLDPKPGERIVDAACGNETFTRQLAMLGNVHFLGTIIPKSHLSWAFGCVHSPDVIIAQHGG